MPKMWGSWYGEDMTDEEEKKEEIEVNAEEPLTEETEETEAEGFEEVEDPEEAKEEPETAKTEDNIMSIEEIAIVLLGLKDSQNSKDTQIITDLYEDGIKNQNLEKWLIYCTGLYSQAHRGVMKDLNSYEWYSKNNKKERFMNGIDTLLERIIDYPKIMNSIEDISEFNVNATSSATKASTLITQSELYEGKLTRLIDLLRANRSIYYYYSEYLKIQRNDLIDNLKIIQKASDESKKHIDTT